jgi:hypothetical protein
MTSDVAATEAVVAKEIARLRMKERENNVILPPSRTTTARLNVPRPSPAFPEFFLEIRPKGTPGTEDAGSRLNMRATRNVLN